MDIFQHVQQMEKDGEAYYRGLAERTPDEGLEAVFLQLAEDEVKHYQVFKKMAERSEVDMGPTEVLAGAKNVFRKMREAGAAPEVVTDHVEAYRKALQVERESEAFYREKAGEVDSPAYRALFERIAEEEKKHAFLLEQVIEFVSRPQQWLENAEFHRLEEY